MKHLATIILLYTFTFNLHLLSAAVPLRWTVETSRAQPETFEAYQGETLDFEATLQSYGKPLEAPSNYAFYWQTNGMGNAWWSKQIDQTSYLLPLTSNLLRATWSPEMDVGARAYNCFIGLSNSIYHAAFQLRLRPSPGAVPNELPLPQKVIDFAQVTVLNPPWSGGGGSGGVDTNAVIDITNPLIATATNDLNTTLSDAIASATNAVPRIVMGASEIRADLTAKVQSGWTDQWEPNNTSTPEKIERHETYYDTPQFDNGDWRCVTYQFDEGISDWVSYYGDYMSGDYTNPDAAELTFPDNTVTRRIPATAETRLAATNDLFATVRSATNDLNTTLNDTISKKADEFTAWDAGPYPNVQEGSQPEYIKTNKTWRWKTLVRTEYDDFYYAEAYDDGGNAVELVFSFDASYGHESFTATRKRVLRTGEAATPQELTNAISTNNPAFVAAVQSIAPPSPPSLRLYDEVRGCYWIGRMVNGVISWEVEE